MTEAGRIFDAMKDDAILLLLDLLDRKDFSMTFEELVALKGRALYITRLDDEEGRARGFTLKALTSEEAALVDVRSYSSLDGP